MREVLQTKNGHQFDELVAAAHELKTPLTLIAHLASLLQDNIIELSPAEQAKALERMQLSAARGLRLVQGLTTSYRLLQPDQLVLPLEPINLAQACEEVAHELQPLAKAQTQAIELQWSDRRQCLVVAHRDFIKNVLGNLIDNALRHNPAHTSVRLSMRRLDTMMRLCVQDNGPGLSRKDLAALHTRLGRQAQPIRSHATNSGLGLYIASQLALAMGGRVGVGTVKQGTDFHVDLRHSTQLSFLA